MIGFRLRRDLTDAERERSRAFAGVPQATAWLRSTVSPGTLRRALALSEPHRAAGLGRLTDVEVVVRAARLVVARQIFVVQSDRRALTWGPPEEASETESFLGPAPEEDEYGWLLVVADVDPTEEPFFHVDATVDDEEHASLLVEDEVHDSASEDEDEDEDDEDSALQIEDELSDLAVEDDELGSLMTEAEVVDEDGGGEGGDDASKEAGVEDGRLQIEDEVLDDDEDGADDPDEDGDGRLEIDDHVEEHPTPA